MNPASLAGSPSISAPTSATVPGSPTAAKSKNSSTNAVTKFTSGPATEISARFQTFCAEYASGWDSMPSSSSATKRQ